MKTSIRILHWTPRIICILAIIFISLFAVLGGENTDLIIWQKIGEILIELIPTYILTALLIVAWKWEFAGGIIYTLIGLGLSPFIFMHNYQMNNSVGHSISTVMIINLPFITVGILFIISHFKKRNQNRDKN